MMLKNQLVFPALLLLLAPLFGQKINDIKFIDVATNNIAYLDAFPVNRDLKLRITGTNLSVIQLVPVAPHLSTLVVVNQTVSGSTNTQREILVRFTTAGSKSVGIRQFRVVAGINKPLTDFQKEFVQVPTCQIYDRPNLQFVSTSVRGVYNRPATKVDCGPLGTGIGQHTTAENSFCLTHVPNPTASAPIQEKTVPLAPITFQIKNASFAPIFTPFKVQIKRGINVIHEVTVNRMIAQEVRTITFNRQEQRKIFVRHRDCTVCYEKLQSPFNWLDPEYDVVIDPDNATGGSSFGGKIPASKP